MSQEKHSSTGDRKYHIGDVGAGARVQQGERLNWIETYTSFLPDDESLVQQFNALFKRIAEHPDLDDDTRALSMEKTEVVAKSLAKAQVSPGELRRALLDAKGWFSSKASWAWDGLVKILKSEAAQKVIATIAEASVRSAIESLIGGGNA